MARTLKVTRSQVAAAKILVTLAAKDGRSVSPGVKAIAEASSKPPRGKARTSAGRPAAAG